MGDGAKLVRDEGVGGSNPLAPTNQSQGFPEKAPSPTATETATERGRR